MANRSLYIAFFFLVIDCTAQLPDTVKLKEVTVTSYFTARPLLRLPSSVSILDSNQLANHHQLSLVPAINSTAGVRMDERSPGSYRLSIRGSLLRSPFGIRNVKIYMDEFSLTDAGGNSYLNLIDVNAINRMEILKGPDGSLFGANSGGVIKINPVAGEVETKFVFNTGLQTGSYQMLHPYLKIQLPLKKNIVSLVAATQHSKGYRENSELNRKFTQVNNVYQYAAEAQLRILFLYSDLQYQTPGGLTLLQMQKDPTAARPPTKFTRGAKEQQAGISNKTIYAGVLNEIKIKRNIKQLTAIFGSHTDYQNPFITNYELRKEKNMGVRTWIEINNSKQGELFIVLNAGTEAQQANSHIRNYGNTFGNIDTLQADDDLIANQHFIFTRAAIDVYNKFSAEISASLNGNHYHFNRNNPEPTPRNKLIFKPQLMPRIALSYLLLPTLSLRGIISRGYSPPTLAEVRSSDNRINKTLQPESGWNYETGFRVRDKNDRVWWDVAVFYYRLQQAIVRQTNDFGQEYFINAGGTNQRGLESQLTVNLIPENNFYILQTLKLNSSYTYSYFRFSNYKNLANNYDGNFITGVPQHVSTTGISATIIYDVSFFAQYNYTSRMPLNDANTDYATAYQIVQLKASRTTGLNRNINLNFFAGVDNLLNEKYSLGPDLNAVGSRYYNPAPGINYYCGISFYWK